MTDETAFIALLRDIATAPGARGLTDDAAVMTVGGERLVLTHDMLVQGVHFRTDDPAEDVAWKLVAVNMSDLAAKGAQPLACMLGYGLAGNDQWNKAFVAGLGAALDHYGAQLLGGDTVRQPAGDARALGLTAVGKASGPLPPSRSGALAGDGLFVTGTIGDGWAGLQLLEAGKDAPARLVQAYRRPVALVDQGRGLAQIAHAMMDVSDGLLLDASRMAQASGLALCIDLDAIPLSPEFIGGFGEDRNARIAAATGGDDYQLLFAADPDVQLPVPATNIGRFAPGSGLSLTGEGQAVALPPRLGWLHDGRAATGLHV